MISKTGEDKNLPVGMIGKKLSTMNGEKGGGMDR